MTRAEEQFVRLLARDLLHKDKKYYTIPTEKIVKIITDNACLVNYEINHLDIAYQKTLEQLEAETKKES